MSDFVTALTNSTTGITANTMWGQVTDLVPFIVVMFAFAFGYRLLRKALKSGAKGKVSI